MRFYLPRFMTLYAYLRDSNYDGLKKDVSENSLWAKDRFILKEAYYIERLTNEKMFRAGGVPSKLWNMGEFVLMCILRYRNKCKVLGSRWRIAVDWILKYLGNNRAIFRQILKYMLELNDYSNGSNGRYYFQNKNNDEVINVPDIECMLELVMPDYMNNKEGMMLAVSLDGMFLKYASDYLRDDEELVRCAFAR